MTDVVEPLVRSRMMSGIKGKDTKPEIIIRKALFARGLRYRLHVKDIPSKPDMVLPKFNAVIFINGCFWHKHDCSLFKWPSSNIQFWKEKIEGNAQRDIKNHAKVMQHGLRSITIWECALKGKNKLPLELVLQKIQEWLYSESFTSEISGN